MSLAVPGAGQLWTRSWWCLAWFLLAGASVALPVWVGAGEGPLAAGWRVAWLTLVGLSSAEHAKRSLEGGGPRRHAARVRSRVHCGRPRGRAVRISIELDVPRPREEVWTRVKDFQRFVCIDPFHTRVLVMRPPLAPGVDLVLEHRAFGIGFLRFGRLLRWTEGEGYAFSDLAGGGPGAGFPHVFFVRVEAGPGGARTSRLTVEVRGKWTARWIPLAVARWWLRYVCREHARLLANSFREAP